MRLALALGVLAFGASAAAEPTEPRTFVAPLGPPGTAAFALENVGEATAEVEIVRLAGRPIAHASADLQAEIDALPPQTPDDLGTRIFRFVADNRRHGWYLTLDFRWFLEPVLFFESSGLATCGEAANEIMLLAAERGIPARRWSLDGHVVAELWIDGAWRMYDGDYGVYFLNRAGGVASVTELAEDPSLVTEPLLRMATPGPWSPYDPFYADLYATQQNNGLVYGPEPTDPPRRLRFTLPPGARLLFPGVFEHAPVSPPVGLPLESHLDLELRLPAGAIGPVENPLILHTARGRGAVALDGETYAFGSPALEAAIAARTSALRTLDILEAEAPTSLLYLVNPVRWAASGDVALELLATPGASLVASAVPLGDPAQDADGDAVPEDGDGSGVPGDPPCADGAVAACDDSCPAVPNRSQWDADRDGAGNACDGDLDQSGAVDAEDYKTLLSCTVGYSPGADPFCRESDLDENGLVDAADQTLFEARFGVNQLTPGCGLGPELAPLVALLLAGRRKRQPHV